MPGEAQPSWVAVLPVKHFPLAKSRLADRFTGPERASLAEAFTRDTLLAVLGTPLVARALIVTDRPPGLTGIPRDVIQLPQRGRPGLDRAVRTGRSEAERRFPGCPILVLVADLPLLTADALGAVLAAAGGTTPRVVPDHTGTGTVMLTAPPGSRLRSHFGADSAARHRAAGYRELRLPDTHPLRLDVDTGATLARLEHRGLGPHTQRALSEMLPLPSYGPALVRKRAE